MTQQIISAIIGYWRMGATDYEIYQVTNISIDVINRIINQYKEHIENDREDN